MKTFFSAHSISATTLPQLERTSHSIHSKNQKADSLLSTLIEKIKDFWQKISSCICSLFCRKEKPLAKVSLLPQKTLDKKENTSLTPSSKTPTKRSEKSITLLDKKLPPENKPSGKEIDNKNPIPPSSPAVSEKPLTLSEPKIKPILPTALTQKMLTYLQPRDIASFFATNRAHCKDGDSQSFWRQLILTHFPRTSIPAGSNCKELFETLSKRREAVVIPNGPSIHVTFYKGMTTVRELKEKISKATRIPVEKIQLERQTRYTELLSEWTALKPNKALVSDFLEDYLHQDGTPHMLYPETRLRCVRLS